MIGRTFTAAVLAATPANAIFSDGDPWAVTDYLVGLSMGAYTNMISNSYGDNDCFAGIISQANSLN